MVERFFNWASQLEWLKGRSATYVKQVVRVALALPFGIASVMLVLSLVFGWGLIATISLMGCLLAVVFFMYGMMLITDSPATESFLIRLRYNQIMIDSEGKEIPVETDCEYFQWDPLAQGGTIFTVLGYDSLLQIANTFHPVTTNPKVRDLKLFVSTNLRHGFDNSISWFRLVHAERDVLVDQARSMVSNWMQYQLYEFVEKNSVELGSLYNPLDKAQQGKLRQLFGEFLQSVQKPQWWDLVTDPQISFNAG